MYLHYIQLKLNFFVSVIVSADLNKQFKELDGSGWNLAIAVILLMLPKAIYIFRQVYCILSSMCIINALIDILILSLNG